MDLSLILILVVIFIVLIWNGILSYFIFKIIGKNKEFFSGNEKGDIYKTINSYLLKMRTIEKQNDSILTEMGKMTENYAGCLQKVEIIRYNPFRDIGGDQSFSVALLNKKNDGIVISSILSREGNRIYSKPIKNGTSAYQLSKEEEQVIGLAYKK